MRELQPQCLVSGRPGGRSQSDYASEGDIPAARADAWETPATLNDTWGFKKHDHNWKKPEDLTFKLVDIVSKGGNYLLNVGPDGEGVIPQPSQDMLRKVGAWR
ncbi:MAG: alpha-L-fucosidase [Kiritimatiellia bacterium]